MIQRDISSKDFIESAVSIACRKLKNFDSMRLYFTTYQFINLSQVIYVFRRRYIIMIILPITVKVSYYASPLVIFIMILMVDILRCCWYKSTLVDGFCIMLVTTWRKSRGRWSISICDLLWKHLVATRKSCLRRVYPYTSKIPPT